MFVASLAMMTACGDKNDNGSSAEEQAQAENVTNEENAEQAPGEAPVKLDLVIDSVIPEDMKAIYAKGDFKPCPAVFFKDDIKAETVGEFPSKWNLNNGSAEVVNFEGQKAINMANSDTEIAPKVAGDSKNYLPDVFTVEFNYYCNGDEDFNAVYHLLLGNQDNPMFDELTLRTEENVFWNVSKTNDEPIEGNYANLSNIEKKNAWNHFAISFNNGSMKMYVNGQRIANLSGLKNPRCFSIRGEGWDDHRYLIKNIRMATVAPAQ